MAYLAFALMFCVGISGGVYLVVSGHPLFAIAVFVITASLRLTSTPSVRVEGRDPAKVAEAARKVML